jgi:phosphoribosylaminoimidazole-succinocarboxamide synthase
MHETRQQQLNRRFYDELGELRTRIENVDEKYRPLLRDAADRAEQQHVHMQQTCNKIADMVADLGLIVEHTKFEVAAARHTPGSL